MIGNHYENMHSAPPGLLARYSCAKLRLPALVITFLAALAGFSVAMGDQPMRCIGLVTLLSCAFALRALERRAGRDEPVLVIDQHGICDRRVLGRTLSWWEIERVFPLDVSRSKVVEFRVRHPEVSLAGASRPTRFALPVLRSMGIPDLCVSALLTDASVADLLTAIEQYAPHLLSSEHRASLAALQQNGRTSLVGFETRISLAQPRQRER